MCKYTKKIHLFSLLIFCLFCFSSVWAGSLKIMNSNQVLNEKEYMLCVGESDEGESLEIYEENEEYEETEEDMNSDEINIPDDSQDYSDDYGTE